MFWIKRRSRLHEIARRDSEKRNQPGIMLVPLGILLPAALFVVHVMHQLGADLGSWGVALLVVFLCSSYFVHEFLKARTDMEGSRRFALALLVGIPVGALLVFLAGTRAAPYCLLLAALPPLVYWQYVRGRPWSRVVS